MQLEKPMNTHVYQKYTRRYAHGESVGRGDLESAFREAAKLVVEQGDEFLPIFERLEQEVETADARESARAKARAIVDQAGQGAEL